MVHSMGITLTRHRHLDALGGVRGVQMEGGHEWGVPHIRLLLPMRLEGYCQQSQLACDGELRGVG